MITTNPFKFWYLILIFSCCLASANLFAQVGIGNTNPDASSLLDIRDAANDAGILIPRVDITNLNTAAPVTSPATSLLVYNTNTTTGPGFFFWNGTVWTSIDGNKDWKLGGNTGTTPGTASGENFIGTTDAQNLVFATNGTERVRIDTNGDVGIGTAANASEKLEVTGNMRLNGAFMPANNAGTVDHALLSAGAGASPTWTPFNFANKTATTTIAKYFVNLTLASDFSPSTRQTFTVTDTSCRNNSSISMSITGPFNVAFEGLIIMNTTTATGQFRFTLYNLTGATITSGTVIPFSFIAFY
ncbi:hypothetical protein [Aequorivita viscosa]|uniref:Uncharacterized protein n=1 Tax=Aequorivita viscosa TaxID=797419 RepID=A0A1M6AT89_9FLAO|nr:hypothetical protein [Aequorivita viscosa]SDW29682.1 hypothetical protein SAMN05216556_10419 [Aequorivita viscosa]SHI39685.1 hypothetical protein SAMN04487908_10219 [Aequorivita viscosa]